MTPTSKKLYSKDDNNLEVDLAFMPYGIQNLFSEKFVANFI